MQNSVRPWLYSRQFDLIIFIGSTLAPLFLYFVIQILEAEFFIGRPEALAIFVFTLFSAIFDSPHILLTLSRTYFDQIEFARHRWLQICALPLSLCVVIAASYFNRMGEFIFVLGLYGAWHIMRQNVGLLKLYQARVQESQSVRSKIEVVLFYILLCLFLFSERNSSHELQGIEIYFGAGSLAVAAFILRSLFLITLLIWFWRIYKDRSLSTLDQPRNLFFLSNMILFSILVNLEVHPLIMTALATVAHNIQYQGWVWMYHRIRYSQKWTAPTGLGLSLIFGIILACISEYVVWPLKVDPITWGTVYNGFVLWHYYIDGKIWKFSSSPELSPLRAGI